MSHRLANQGDGYFMRQCDGGPTVTQHVGGERLDESQLLSDLFELFIVLAQQPFVGLPSEGFALWCLSEWEEIGSMVLIPIEDLPHSLYQTDPDSGTGLMALVAERVALKFFLSEMHNVNERHPVS